MNLSSRSPKIIGFLKHVLLGITILVLTVAIAGMVYETAATEADHRNFPPPGNLIDVGGFKMHIDCKGTGSPTVILEAMSGGMSPYWGWIQPEVAKQTRVCVYDRAGFGWSEPDLQPPSLERTARNLHTLLVNANIVGPYVLVGNSIGGVYVRQFAADYPAEALGMVLVDEAHPLQFQHYPEMFKDGDDYLRLSGSFPTLARLGAFRLYFALGGEMDFAELPETQRSEVKALWSSPEYFVAQRAEIEAAHQIWTDALKLGSLGDMPLIVISRGVNLDYEWNKYQAELATLSTNSRHIMIDEANHGALVFDQKYARLVSDAVLQIVNVVRGGAQLGG